MPASTNPISRARQFTTLPVVWAIPVLKAVLWPWGVTHTHWSTDTGIYRYTPVFVRRWGAKNPFTNEPFMVHPPEFDVVTRHAVPSRFMNAAITEQMIKLISVKKGKMSIFMRGFIERVIKEVDDGCLLRDAQAAGLEELSLRDVGVPTPGTWKKWCQELKTMGLIDQEKKGRNYWVALNVRVDVDRLSEMLESEWGMSAAEPIPDDPKGVVAAVLIRPRRASFANPIPKDEYTLLWKAFKAGQLDIVFIKSKGNGR